MYIVIYDRYWYDFSKDNDDCEVRSSFQLCLDKDAVRQCIKDLNDDGLVEPSSIRVFNAVEHKGEFI